MNLSQINKNQIAEWVDLHRKTIIRCDSFEDAAWIISRDLFRFKTKEPFVIKLIVNELHGSHCGCADINHKIMNGHNEIVKYDLLRNWMTL